MDILFFSVLTNLLYYSSGRILISKNQYDFHSQFYVYFLGLMVISFIALLLNFFTKLSPLINSLIYIIIFIIFIIKTKFNFNKKNFNFLIIASLITFLLILFSNVNRPDAGLYHLPLISTLNDYKIIFGLNNIHFRFGLSSIMQYLAAINNNLLFKENGISIPLASAISFFYIYFFYDVWNLIKRKESVNIGNIFSLFIITYISYKLTRYSSFGNDAVPHLSFFYLISYILKNNIESINFKKVFLISVFIFINKPTLGLVFIITLAIFIIKKNLEVKKIIKTIFTFPSFLIIIWLIKNVIISGCAVYPMKITCINSLPWTDSIQVDKAYTESQAWSKGWPDRINKSITIDDFNKNFNWISAWSNKHLKYILKILIPYILVLLVIFFYIRKNLYSSTKIKDKDKDLDKRYLIVLFTCLFGTTSFFTIFPIYRYGYSFIISLIILIFIFFIKDKILLKKKTNLFKIIFAISIVAFLGKQFQKIYNNNQNGRWPNIYTLDKNGIINDIEKIKISENFFYYHANSGDNLCMYSTSPCTSYKLKNRIKYKEIFSYSFLNLK